MRKLTQARLRELVDYNPLTGLFTLKLYRGGIVKTGGVLGNLNMSGYIHIRVDGKEYKAHRLAFLYMEGFIPDEVYHINRIRNDNRWVNLREATRGSNCRNQNVIKVDGLPIGVYRHRNKFKAIVGVNYRNKYLGLFETPEAATLARDQFIASLDAHAAA